MGDTERMMLATLYAGPADGAILAVLEPVPVHLRFPMTPAEYEQQLGPLPHGNSGPPPLHVPAMYRLALEHDDQGRETSTPRRDPHGRITYLYLRRKPTTATPTEGEHHV